VSQLWDESGSGLNTDTEAHDRVRCARCGFPCVLSRDIHYPYGSHVGWGIKYIRQFTDTVISGATVVELPEGTGAVGAILTEDGFEITTEDGQTIIIQ